VLEGGEHPVSRWPASANRIDGKPARTLVDLVKWIDQLGVELEDIHLKRPTLKTCSSSSRGTPPE